MIEFITAFATSDGLICATLEEAQVHELNALLDGVESARATEVIVEHKAEVIDILTTTKTSRPKARKIHGGKKARKTEATAE